MWRSTLRNQFLRQCFVNNINRKFLKSSVAAISQVQKIETEQVVKSGSTSPEPIQTSPYLSVVPKKTLNEQFLSFDDIPGPKSLRMISKFWGMIPVMGTELTVSIIQYFLSGGKFFGGVLSWGGNASFFKKFFDIYGPVVRLHGAFGSDVVLLKKPEDACAIFESEGKYPIRSCLDSIEKYRVECRKYTQPGPFLTHGSEWEKVRKSLEQPLQTTVAEQHGKIRKICESFVERITILRNKQEEMPPDFKVEICKWSLECLSAACLNKDLGFLNPHCLSPTSDSSKLLDGLLGATEAIRRCEYGFHLWKFVETPAWKVLVKNCDKIDTVLSKHVEEAITSLKYKQDKGGSLEKVSFLESLFLHDGIIKEDVMTILLDMYLIGANATAHTAAFLLYHLSRNPRCQIKIHEEVRKYPENIGRDDLKKMKYLQACIKESLRLDPPIPILSRVLSNDITIHHYRIPKGTHILFASHLNKMGNEYFEDSSWFKPERWFSDEHGGFGNEYQAFASMPFGYGPRACLAKDLAETEIGMLIFKVCRQFKIEYNYGDIKSSNELLASPTKSLKFRFVKRVL
ncbi:unnamed protein product [Phaedon cochleariae]|uniref:Cytochrome P450 n=1 Tax=Phaedon cochleariae TaxID=80249 RepID=A0A9P0GNW3_PHACE|nr:unnamed protein product [Phaedon cochleariae]